MRPQFVLALILFKLSAFITQTVSAAQVLAVASNGKWDMEYDPNKNVNAVAEQAIAACKAKGGTDPKIVWSKRFNYYYYGALGKGFPKQEPLRLTHGAIAISDNGNGTIVGWSFAPFHKAPRAEQNCRRKGGQHPKVVAVF
jgi:hypothetical protein